MARPKTGKPRKQNLMLTVDAQTRIHLAYISSYRNESISAMVSEWAAKEAKRIERASKQPIPDAEQTTLDLDG